jgi:hypothetical protein
LIGLRDALARASASTWRPVVDASRQVRRIRRDEAERELARVHVAEVARLLREAVMLRCAASRTSTAWRARARAELAQWRVDGFESPAVLRACVVRPVHRWDDARSLARAAFALVPCNAARLCLACAELDAGRAYRAIARIEALLARDLEPELRRAAVRVLAEADRRRDTPRGEG